MPEACDNGYMTQTHTPIALPDDLDLDAEDDLLEQDYEVYRKANISIARRSIRLLAGHVLAHDPNAVSVVLADSDQGDTLDVTGYLRADSGYVVLSEDDVDNLAHLAWNLSDSNTGGWGGFVILPALTDGASESALAVSRS